MSWLKPVRDLLPGGAVSIAFDLIVITVAAWLAYVVVGRIIDAVIRRASARAGREESRQRVLGIGRLIRNMLLAAVIFLAGLAAMRLEGLGGVITRAVSARILGTALVAWIAFRLVHFATAAAIEKTRTGLKEDEQRQRVTTLFLLARNVAKYVIIFVGAVTVLSALNIDVTPIIAGAGILGLAVGFGAQNLVRDVISGFFIVAEGQYSVGDLVELNGVFGRVEQVGLRMTRLRQPDGQLRFLPNGSIASANRYTEDMVAHVITLPIPQEAPEDPISLVRSVLDDFEREFTVFAEHPEVALDTLPTYARVVRITTRATPGRHSLVEQKLPLRLSAALERAGHPLPAGTDVSVAPLFPPPGEIL